MQECYIGNLNILKTEQSSTGRFEEFYKQNFIFIFFKQMENSHERKS